MTYTQNVYDPSIGDYGANVEKTFVKSNLDIQIEGAPCSLKIDQTSYDNVNYVHHANGIADNQGNVTGAKETLSLILSQECNVKQINAY